MKAPIADLAGAVLMEINLQHRAHGPLGLDFVAPCLLDVLGYACADANGGRVSRDDVAALVADTDRAIRHWIADPGAADRPRSDLALARREVEVEDIAEMIVLTTATTAADVSDEGKSPAAALIVAGLLREAGRHMLGGLVASLRDEPVDVDEIDTLLEAAARRVRDRIAGEGDEEAASAAAEAFDGADCWRSYA